MQRVVNKTNILEQGQFERPANGCPMCQPPSDYMFGQEQSPNGTKHQID